MMERMKLVEPQQPAKVGEFRVDGPAEICFKPLLERLFNITRESRCGEHGREIPIQFAIVGVSAHLVFP